MLNRIFSARTFFVLSGLFIFYATTIPWDMSAAPSLSRVNWVPGWDSSRGRIWSIPDMVQNVVLFLPYGFFGYLSLKPLRDKGPVLGGLLMGLLGLALSLFVEVLQTMSSTRSPAATDLVTNFGGALVGGVTAGIYLATFSVRLNHWISKTVAERPGILIFGLYALAIVSGSLAPFIPTLDIGLLRASVRSFLNEPWGPKGLGALWADGLLFGALAYLTVRELPAWLGAQRWFPGFKGPIGSRSALVFALVLVAALALGLELAQIVIIGHSPGLQDAVVGLVCGILGASLAALGHKHIQPAHSLGEESLRRPQVILGFAIALPIVRALQPFELQSLSAGLADVSGWNLVPFWALFRNLNLSTFRNVFEASAVYLPLGYALFARGRPPWFGFVACLGLAELLEVAQLFVAGRVVDITEGVYAGLMALLGAWILTALRARVDFDEAGDTNPTIPLQAVRAVRAKAASMR